MMDRNLDTKSAALFLGVSTKTLRRLCKGDDPIPHFRVGREYRFRESGIRAWIANRERNATQSSPPNHGANVLSFVDAMIQRG